MKVKLRFGKKEYWNKKEDWQGKANMNVMGLIVISIILVLTAIGNKNYVGAWTFGIIMFLYTAPQKYQYEKWYRKNARIKAGLDKDDRKEKD